MRSIRSYSICIAFGLSSLCAGGAAGQGVAFRQSAYTTGSGPGAVVVADFDGDGKLDLAVANSGSNSISILLGNGDGTFGAKTDFATATNPRALSADDLNGDGKLDLVVCAGGADKISVLLGNGNGTFGAKTDFATGSIPASVVLADFNGDSMLDMAVASAGGNTVSFLPGNGDGTFGGHVEFATGSGPASIVAGDFNGDGRLDVATANNSSDSISLLLGNGDGTFGAKTDFAVSTQPVSLARGDFNADSKLDLVAAARAAALASVLLGKGDGTFNPKTDLGTETEPIAVTAADFNADGKLDAMTGNLGTTSYLYYGYSYTVYYPSLSLALGDGSGNFNGFRFSLFNIPAAIATGDFNADGRIDLAIANDRDNQVSILLQAAEIDFNGGGLNFGRISSGATSASKSVTIHSTGSFDLTISGVGLSGTNSGDFNIAGDTCSSTPVPSGSSCTLSAAFAPTAPGDKSANLVFQSNAQSGAQSIFLFGTGAGAGTLTVAPANLIFGNVKVGTTSAAQQSQLSNTGAATLNLFGISVADYNIAEFSKTTTCGSSLAVGAQCSVSVTFVPSGRQTFGAAVQIDTDALVSPTLVTLSGTGADGVPSISGTTSFGNQPVNVPSAPLSITLTNVGDMDLVVSAVAVTNNGAVFSQTNNCVVTLAPTASCTINVKFTPTGSLHYVGSLSISHDAVGSPLVVSLDGTGFVPPVAVPTPTSLDFGNQIVATSSAAKTVTLTNTGGTTLNISSLTISGDYTKTDNCGASVNAGASCTINVTFTPSTTGTRNGAVTITDDAAGSPHSVSLTGNGVTPPAVSLSMASLTFNSQLVGSTSAAQTVTLTNTGGATLSITGMTVIGANAGDFTRSDNCGTSVNGGASCVVTVAFKPTATGSRAASVSISTNASGSPHMIALAGTGTDFNVAAASGGSTTTTVSPGGSGSFTLSLTPNGFTGNVALSCSTSSAEVSCAVPASVNIGGGTTNVTVNVTATSRAWGLPPVKPPSDGWRIATAWMAMLLLLSVMLRWGVARRGQAQARWCATVALACACACAQLCMGCGGGSGPPPPRTYTITVNASAAGVVRTIGLSVIVP